MASRNKKQRRRRFPWIRIAALLVIAWLVTSAWFDLPPASWFMEANPAESQAPTQEKVFPPFPDKPPFRFGSRALAGVCNEYGFDTESIVEGMNAFTIRCKPEWSIKRIAKENNMETGALFEVIRQLSQNGNEQP
jgi:hypothetical protein